MIDTPRYKELQHRLAQQTTEKGRIETLVDIAEEVRNFDVDQAMKLAEDIIQRARSVAYPRWLGRGLNLKGSCLWMKGEYEAALEILKDALSIATKTKDKILEAGILYHFGNIYRDLGDLANVLTYFEKALAINEELGDEFSQSVILTSVSNLLYDLNDHDNALQYALKCLPIFERAHDIASLINIHNTLGNIYFKKDMFQEALFYFEKNMSLSEQGTPTQVMAESGLGKVYYKMHNYDNANRYLSSALKQSQILGNVEVQIISHFYQGRLYMDSGSYFQALQSLESSYALAQEYNRRHDLMSIHEMMSALFDIMGDIPKAFHHLKSYEHLKEEIFKQKTLNELHNLQVKQEIELAKKEKEVAERTAYLKHQFMANMSHEIRTPMNAVVGMTRLLLLKDPKADQLRYLNAIELSANNLLVIINDILDLSKIEAGKIVIEETDFTLSDILNMVGDMMMLKVEEKGLDFRINIDEKLPRRLIGDPTRLNQVIINLAGNAIKFTDRGYVEVKATLLKNEGAKLWLQFDVIDTGIGIAKDYVDKIFDSFTQAGTDISRKFGGTGLGLTISRQLVSLMGGDISVKSELNKGTVFTVVLPFEEAPVQDQVTKKAKLNAKALQRLNHSRVLLAEDNEFNRLVAEDTLKELVPGLELDIVVNGQEAVDKLKEEMYDLVLMDIQMPLMDGVAATKAIRSELPLPNSGVKIIAMTANVLAEDVKTYLDAGMDAYVTKPFQADELLIKMDQVLGDATPMGRKRQKVELPQQKEIPAKPVVAEKAKPVVVEAITEKLVAELPKVVTNRQFLSQFTGGNPEKMKKYINMFLESAPKLLDNIDRALEAKDYQAVKIAAHSMKPQLSYMGVKEEVSHIFLIEQSAGESAHYDSLKERVINLKLVCEKAFTELRSS